MSWNESGLGWVPARYGNLYIYVSEREGDRQAFKAIGSNKYRLSSVSSVQSLSHVLLFATPWTAARQASLSIANSQSLLKLISIESMMPSNHLILCTCWAGPKSLGWLLAALETREVLMRSSLKAVWRQNSHLPWGKSIFSFWSRQQIGWDPLTLWRIIYLTQTLLIKLAILI